MSGGEIEENGLKIQLKDGGESECKADLNRFA